ncbi:membrane-spanning 4-domains subfamily A member 4A-like [Archocentrus centrarchus]|uniref:membrane-spanning 4-domains subfamily A member 4A-like n=1 Tax=Archocentrus centrarchus TaxID=63155 RepID=UPI0011EA2ACE|nr:membrane-spanning 4-domains subfamily A member 4A-like [Archocentrus centrarchus]
MADEAAVVEEDLSAAQSPLVAVSFQRNIRRKEKFLEAEPKALGITQIVLGVYTIVFLSVFLINGLDHWGNDIPFFISSVLVVIAGVTAVAAQNLHLPTLRACLGMQIVACAASIASIICSLIKLAPPPSFCWRYYDYNSTHEDGETCHEIESINSHFFAGAVLIHATLFAISVTLTAYCCKVANCCGPPPKMPVITVQAPPAQE